MIYDDDLCECIKNKWKIRRKKNFRYVSFGKEIITETFIFLDAARYPIIIHQPFYKKKKKNTQIKKF